MIEVTSLGGNKFHLNNELIYKIESFPDTTIILLDGKVLVVRESIDEVVEKIVKFKRKIYLR